MQKPYIVCHMMITVNGRIIAENWGETSTVDRYAALYETYHDQLGSQAWMVGRVTLEKDFTGGRKPELPASGESVDREPFVGDKDATSFAIAVDTHGKLGWDTNELDGDHIIQILDRSVSNAYLHYLRAMRVSYVFAGQDGLVLAPALTQIAALFPIRTILLEGGGGLNGSMLSEGLIDELSLLILPLTDGTAGASTVFEVADGLPRPDRSAMRLIEAKPVEDDVLWARYKRS